MADLHGQEREALTVAAKALWGKKRGVSSRPFDWEDSGKRWEEDAQIVIEAYVAALAVREEPKNAWHEDPEMKPRSIFCPKCGSHTGHYDLRGQLENALSAAREDTEQEPKP